MMYIWPIVTGVTFLDVWTLAHLGFWTFVASSLWAFKANKWWAFFSCLAVAGAWEIFEKFAESKWPDRWLDPESWVNSWISDLLTCIVAFWGVWFLWNNRKRRK